MIKKKKAISIYYIIFLAFCLVLQGSPSLAGAISKDQEITIKSHCNSIKEKLHEVQKEDSKIRVHLGSHYEAILTNFITPLNVRLVENNLSNAKFVENQNNFAETKSVFSSDFISYQKSLEELIGMNCEENPEDFYTKLEKVRQKRKIMNQDVLKMRTLISDHIKSVTEIMRKVQ